MLRQELSESEESISAAQVRVTPQELARAVAAVEARQGGEADTIALGEAIAQLGLSVTPEELLAQVEAARRAELAAEEWRRTRKRRIRTLLRSVIGGIGTCAVVVLLLAVVAHVRLAPMRAPVAVSSGLSGNEVNSDISGVMQAINANSFDNGKLDTVKMFAKTRSFNSAELREVLSAFSFDADRANAAVLLYPNLTDPQNFYQALDTFSFDAGRQDVLRRLDLN